MAVEIKKLIYRSKHRGCKEMDIVLGNFAGGAINLLNNNELVVYEQLLEEPDNDIWDWMSGRIQAPEKYAQLVSKINAQ